MSYKPNFADPRVIARAHKCIAFVDKFVRANESQWLSNKWIHHPNHFGSNRNPISLYLKELLLICVNKSYRVSKNEIKGKCKEYRKNTEGMRYLKSQLGLLGSRKSGTTNKTKSTQNINSYCCVDLHPVFAQHADEFITGDFATWTKSNREFHQCQFLPATIKDVEFSRVGYRYNSDIICAAPTILYQLAKKSGYLKKDLVAIEYYINNRTLVRTRLCDLLEMNTTPDERKKVKRIISGFFNGLKLTHQSDSTLVRALSGRHILIDRLKEDLFLTRLRKEISIMWKAIKQHNISMGVKTKLTPRNKSEIYRVLEEQIKNSVKKYMRTNGILIFTEHDGWRTNKIYDARELRGYIKRTTGYNIEFEIEWDKTTS